MLRHGLRGDAVRYSRVTDIVDQRMQAYRAVTCRRLSLQLSYLCFRKFYRKHKKRYNISQK